MKIILLFFTYFIILESPVAAKLNNDQGLFFVSAETEKALIAPALKTFISTDISGLLITTTVRQHFVNPTNNWVEAIYLFPLRDKSSVESLKMKIGNRFIEGKIKEKHEAEKSYTEAKNKGQKASLVSKINTNIFRTNVANIGPNEMIAIEISYTDRVILKDGQYSFRLPTVIGPRYVQNKENLFNKEINNIPESFPEMPQLRNPDLPTINPYTLKINLNAGFNINNISAPYHEILTKHISEQEKQITLKNYTMPSIRDFILTWDQKSSIENQISIFAQKWKNDLYLYTNFFPPTDKEIIKKNSTPRDIILVIDKSGSMQGSSMRQLKKSLYELLNMVDETTRINVLSFHDSTQILFKEPKFATTETVKKIKSYIDFIEAEGGTNMLPAIHRALKIPEQENRLTQVVVLSDANIWDYHVLLDMIEKEISNKRLFFVGIGSAPNEFLIKQASKIGKGTHLLIGKRSETKEKITSLFHKLQYPTITDLDIDIKNFKDIEIFPSNIPDLYFGEPFTIMIKIPNQGILNLPKLIKVTGKLNGHKLEYEISRNNISFSKSIHKLYASDKIESISLDYLRSKIPEYEKIANIKKLGLKHKIVTPYTSLIAVDLIKERPIEHKEIISYQIGQNLPDGWEWEENSEINQINLLLKASLKSNLDDTNLELDMPEIDNPMLVAMVQTSTPRTYFFFLGLLLSLLGFIFFYFSNKWRII